MRREQLLRVASFVVTAFALSGTLILSTRLLKFERDEIDKRTEAASLYISSQVQLGVLGHIEPLQRLGVWWISQGRPMGAEDWETDAQLFLKGSPSLKRIFWFSRAGVPGWSAIPGAKPLRGANPESDQLKKLVQTAKGRGSPALFTAFDAAGGEASLYVCVPVERDHVLHGYLVGLYSVPELTEASIQNRLPLDYQVRVTSQGRTIYSKSSRVGQENHAFQADIKLFDEIWTISVRLDTNHFLGFQSIVYTLAIMLVASLYVSAVLIHVAIRRSAALQRANSALQVEMEERKRAEATASNLEHRLLRGQKLQSLGVMAAGIAHDFNNLLTGILGNAALALDSVPKAHEARESLVSIISEGRRAADLTKQMLAYTGRSFHKLKPAEVADLITGMKDALVQIAGDNVQVDFRIEQFLPAIKADADEIRQVMENIVRNAAEAITPNSGLIEIAATSCRLSEADLQALLPDEELAAGIYIKVNVEDNGPGMLPEVAAQVFDPFFTTKFLGRGLGLSAAQGIMRAHRGGIRIDSFAGAGSCIQLFFPADLQSVQHCTLSK